MTRPARQLPAALEELSFRSQFPTRPAEFVHGLHLDPRMHLESIADLAERLPQSVVCDTAAQALLVPRGGPPKGVLDRPGDVIRSLNSNNSWLTLLNVEDDPAYAEMMDAALDQVELGMREREGKMRQRAAFILTSSPSSVTPVHFDIEHSLLMQTSGSKRVTIGRFESEAAHRYEVDRYFDGSHGRIESMPQELMSYQLEPGTGVYIPPLVPALGPQRCRRLDLDHVDLFHRRDIAKQQNRRPQLASAPISPRPSAARDSRLSPTPPRRPSSDLENRCATPLENRHRPRAERSR